MAARLEGARPGTRSPPARPPDTAPAPALHPPRRLPAAGQAGGRLATVRPSAPVSTVAFRHRRCPRPVAAAQHPHFRRSIFRSSSFSPHHRLSPPRRVSRVNMGCCGKDDDYTPGPDEVRLRTPHFTRNRRPRRLDRRDLVEDLATTCFEMCHLPARWWALFTSAARLLVFAASSAPSCNPNIVYRGGHWLRKWRDAARDPTARRLHQTARSLRPSRFFASSSSCTAARRCSRAFPSHARGTSRALPPLTRCPAAVPLASARARSPLRRSERNHLVERTAPAFGWRPQAHLSRLLRPRSPVSPRPGSLSPPAASRQA